MPTLSLDGVSKVYPGGKAPAVQDVSLRMEDGEIVCLLGSSGCGKTSTLRMIAGFETVSRGTIRIGDRMVNRLRPAERNIAMAFEGYALYPPLRVVDNLAFGLLRHRRPRAEIDARVRRIAAMLEIEDILDRYPPTISGGQQQRVSLARALIRTADATMLDEPMSQLEPQLRAVLRARIKDFLIRHGKTTVCVTHDQTEAIALSDRIAVMEKGVLQQFDTPEALKDRPANLFVASFIGEPPMNLFTAEVAGTGLVVLNDDGEPAFTLPPPRGEAARRVLYRGRRVRLGIRPHQLRIVGEGAIPATVLSNQWLGDQTHLGLSISGCFVIAVTTAAVAADADGTLAVALPETALHVFDLEHERALLHGGAAAEA
jgi:multiple sugar transport system ATP-binding protein